MAPCWIRYSEIMLIKSAYCFCIRVIKTGPQMALWQLNMCHDDCYSDINHSYSQENLTRVCNKLVTDTLINWIKLCWFIRNRRMISRNTLIACMYQKALIWDSCALVWYVFCWETFMAGGRWYHTMVTSSNGNIFRVTGHLSGEFTGHRLIPRTKASDAEFGDFFDLRMNKRLSKQWWGWWFETPSCPLWRHCNAMGCLRFNISMAI